MPVALRTADEWRPYNWKGNKTDFTLERSSFIRSARNRTQPFNTPISTISVLVIVPDLPGEFVNLLLNFLSGEKDFFNHRSHVRFISHLECFYLNYFATNF